MDGIDIEKYAGEIMDWAIIFVPKLLIAIVILIVGFRLLRKVDQWVGAALRKANVGPEIEQFFGSMAEILLKAVVILVAASVVGIKFSAIFGILAAAGFAVGLALQGFMGNFASGLTIIFFKPYKVGDWVSVADTFGKVEGIQIFNTTLVTPGDKTLIIPNGKVTDGVITNFSTKGQMRIELNVTMPYEESFPRVKEIILETLQGLDSIMHDPAPLVGIESYDSHNIVLAIRPYINPDYYWDATFEVYEAVKSAFKANGIKVAYSEGVELGPIGA